MADEHDIHDHPQFQALHGLYHKVTEDLVESIGDRDPSSLTDDEQEQAAWKQFEKLGINKEVFDHYVGDKSYRYMQILEGAVSEHGVSNEDLNNLFGAIFSDGWLNGYHYCQHRYDQEGASRV